MAKRSSRADVITVRNLSPEDLEWLKTEAERLGCDVENYVRILIRQRRAPIVMAPPPTLMPAPTSEEAYHAAYSEELEAEPVFRGHTHDAGARDDVSDDRTLDEVMSAAPSFLDRPPEPQRRPAQPRGRRYAQQFARSALPVRSVAPPPPATNGAFAAFTRTAFVSMSDRAVNGYQQYDGAGNVMRQNMAHFGLDGGGRARRG